MTYQQDQEYRASGPVPAKDDEYPEAPGDADAARAEPDEDDDDMDLEDDAALEDDADPEDDADLEDDTLEPDVIVAEVIDEDPRQPGVVDDGTTVDGTTVDGTTVDGTTVDGTTVDGDVAADNTAADNNVDDITGKDEGLAVDELDSPDALDELDSPDAPDALDELDSPDALDANAGPAVASMPAEPATAAQAPYSGEQTSQQWRDIQAGFVDDPQGAVRLAAQAADEAMTALVTALRERQTALGSAGTAEDTEMLRSALREYRQFCEGISRVGLGLRPVSDR